MDQLTKQERARLIDNIKCLYPPDIHPEGRELLIQALRNRWQSLPDEILLELSSLCSHLNTFESIYQP